MSEHKNRISKKALKILHEIICEDSFEGKRIKQQLPATRRIYKSKEGLWEYIRSELERRSDEHYDLATLSSGWYYNLRNAESSLDKLDLTLTADVAIQMMGPLERHSNEHMANRHRGGSRVENEEEQDIKLTPDQMVLLSRRSTAATANNSAEAPLHVQSDMTVPLLEHLPRSRHHSTCSTHVSRNNSTMSVSGYDADNEKGLIKRRRKELKTRGERQMEVKIEVEDEEVVEKTEEEKNENEVKNGDDDNEMMEEEEEAREKEERGERQERERMLDNLKGMIENLTDHIMSLRIIGAIDTAVMESLADSFENASKSVRNNKDAA